jgi:two-component system, NarL family, sensor kinase
MEQLIAAEQDERRRLADYLHDSAVQSLAAIALMLDAGASAIDAGKLDAARDAVEKGALRLRETVRELRDLSFDLEPVVLRDQGFGYAVGELFDRIRVEDGIPIEADVTAASALAQRAQAVLYQIIREAVHESIRRGPPSSISVSIREGAEGDVDVLISDDAPGERRRTVVTALEERARVLGGTVAVEGTSASGTTIRVTLPAFAVRE